jgi:hypothetical protein
MTLVSEYFAYFTLSEREAKVEDYQELDLKRMVFTREKRWFAKWKRMLNFVVDGHGDDAAAAAADAEANKDAKQETETCVKHPFLTGLQNSGTKSATRSKHHPTLPVHS